MMMEENLEGQTKELGEVMRSYRGFGLPGIDMLCDRREYNTAKQAASAAHQYGCPGVASELYGATDWDFDFRGHKLAGDWQACLGVTFRVPHLAWYSMKGEAKRDLPASIFYQSPWYKEYGMLETHYARINTVMTRGVPRVRIGVLHPIETYWLHFGPASQTSDIRKELETRFSDLTKWLLFSQLDFDFIAESLLEDLYQVSHDKRFHVGKMEYDVVIVPGMETIRTKTPEALGEFWKDGGSILVMGEAPHLTEGKENSRGTGFLQECKKIGYSKQALLSCLSGYRDIEIWTEEGKRADCFLYQMREECGQRYLFIVNGKTIEGWSAFPGGKEQWYNEDIPVEKKILAEIKGEWSAQLLDTMTGEIHAADTEIRGGNTWIRFALYEHDSILLHLTSAQIGGAQITGKDDKKISEDKKISKDEKAREDEKVREEFLYIKTPVNYTLEEENVLVLDQAYYCLDGGSWEGPEELLRIDNILRKRLGYPLKTEAFAQPWTETERYGDEHEIKLKFNINSEISVEGTCLAIEDPEDKEILFNGNKILGKKAGYYVDHDIQTVSLGGIIPGKNVLEIHMPYGRRANIEWCFLLGRFGVRTAGNTGSIIPLPQKLYFGDCTVQGFPFYGGSLCYEFETETEEGIYSIDISHFSGALIGVYVDGKDAGRIAFSPYILRLGKLQSGVHRFQLKLFGNRRNTFGAMHNSDKKERWYGPDAWRTEGEKWSYEYQLRPMGILQAPKLIKSI